MEEKEKKINKNENKEPKKKKRASLKSILGGDILATDFLPDKIAGTHYGIYYLLYP